MKAKKETPKTTTLKVGMKVTSKYHGNPKIVYTLRALYPNENCGSGFAAWADAPTCPCCGITPPVINGSNGYVDSDWFEPYVETPKAPAPTIEEMTTALEEALLTIDRLHQNDENLTAPLLTQYAKRATRKIKAILKKTQVKK